MPNEDDKKNDALFNWKAESRLDWTTKHWGPDDARQVLQVGCLMRIAASLEQLEKTLGFSAKAACDTNVRLARLSEDVACGMILLGDTIRSALVKKQAVAKPKKKKARRK